MHYINIVLTTTVCVVQFILEPEFFKQAVKFEF